LLLRKNPRSEGNALFEPLERQRGPGKPRGATDQNHKIAGRYLAQFQTFRQTQQGIRRTEMTEFGQGAQGLIFPQPQSRFAGQGFS